MNYCLAVHKFIAHFLIVNWYLIFDQMNYCLAVLLLDGYLSQGSINSLWVMLHFLISITYQHFFIKTVDWLFSVILFNTMWFALWSANSSHHGCNNHGLWQMELCDSCLFLCISWMEIHCLNDMFLEYTVWILLLWTS